MYYKKLTTESNIIEYHYNWLGEETVVVNGNVMSKKYSMTGKDHHFILMENGSEARYVLTSKFDMNMTIYLDLIKNRKIIFEDVPVLMGNSSTQKGETPKKESPYKSSGLQKLNAYKIEEAIQDFQNVLDKNPNDPEVYFHLACAYSILEKTVEGYEALKKAIEYNLNNRDMILTHPMLSYLRIQDAFEDFVQSGYTKYNIKSLH